MAPHTGMSLQCQRGGTEKTTETSLHLYFFPFATFLCLTFVFD